MDGTQCPLVQVYGIKKPESRKYFTVEFSLLESASFH
jgi:hypothetical protein